MDIQFEVLKKHFPKDWVDNISNIFNEYVFLRTPEECPNKEFFVNSGNYIGRNDKTLHPEVSNYFNRTLYAVNICILDYVCRDLEKYRKMAFVDNGAGFGLLSVYLSKLGINCWGYDEFTQMKDDGFAMHLFLKTKFHFLQVKSSLPEKADVLTSSSIWVTNPKYLAMDFKELLFDFSFEQKQNIFYENKYKGFKKTEGYNGNLVIYKA